MEVVTAYNYDPFFEEPGGGITYIDNLIHEFLDKDIKVTLFGLDLASERTFTHPNFTFIPVASGRSSLPRFVFDLWKKLHTTDISDNAVVHTYHPLTMFPFLFECPDNPSVCTLHGLPLGGEQAAGGAFYKTHPYLYPIVKAGYVPVEKYLLQQSTMITTAGKRPKKNLYKRYGEGWMSEKIVEIPPGVNLERFRPMDMEELREKHALDPDQSIFLYAGRLAPIKNVELLLRSYRRVEDELENPILLILGHGGEKQSLKEYAEKLGIESIRWLGNVPSDAVPELMNCADVFTVPSTFESGPIVVKEALACGTPIVSTDVGDVREVVEPCDGGIILDDPTDDEFASAMMQALNSNPGINSKNQKLRDSILDRYSWTALADEMIDVYEDAAATSESLVTDRS